MKEEGWKERKEGKEQRNKGRRIENNNRFLYYWHRFFLDPWVYDGRGCSCLIYLGHAQFITAPQSKMKTSKRNVLVVTSKASTVSCFLFGQDLFGKLVSFRLILQPRKTVLFPVINKAATAVDPPIPDPVWSGRPSWEELCPRWQSPGLTSGASHYPPPHILWKRTWPFQTSGAWSDRNVLCSTRFMKLFEVYVTPCIL